MKLTVHISSQLNAVGHLEHWAIDGEDMVVSSPQSDGYNQCWKRRFV